MKNNIKVSILCLTYNQEKYIRQALESFIMQKTDFDFEILIHDDASNDGTQDIIREFENKYPGKIRTFFQKKNQYSEGIRGMMMKFLFPHAKGEYIALCEGDDFFSDKDKLQLQVDFLDKNLDYSVCFHCVRIFFENGEESDSIYPNVKYLPELVVGELLKNNFIPTMSVMYRKQNYEYLPKTNIVPGDWYLHLYHAKFGKIGFVDRVMSAYRRHSNGIWWDSYGSQDNLLKKHGVFNVAMYFELLKIYGNNFEYKKIIYQNIDSLFNKLIEIDNKYKTSLIKELISEYPEPVADFFIENKIRNELSLMESLITERSIIVEKDNVITKKDAIIAEKDNIIIEKDNIINEKDRLLIEILATLNNINQSIIIYPILVLRNKIKKTLRQTKLLFLRFEQATIYFGRNSLKEDIKKYLRPFLRKKYRVRVVDADNKKWKYPLVSVITPYYNRAHTINETIESVLGQTFQDFEYIIVDDGSSDIESIKVFDEINNPKIRKIKQKNQGVASARNRGISEARGKYILCLDSDDTIDPTYLEKAISIMEMKPQYDIVYSNIKFFGLDDGVYCYESEFDVKKLIECNMFITASIFKRKFWEKVGGYKTDLGFEDWEFWISLVEKGAQVKLIPEFLFNYRKAENSQYIEDIKKSEENIRKIKGFHPHYLKNIAEIARQDKIKYIFKDENNYINIENPKQYLSESGETSKKSILFLMPWLTFGGAETVVHNLCSQIKEDFNISIITGLKSEHEWEYKFKEITSQIYHLANLFENSEEYFEFVVNYIKTRKIDLIHIVHNSSFYEMLPRLKKLYPKIKIVNTTFNTIADHFENSISCSNCIDMYTTDNSKVADSYKKGCSFGSEKIKVIHNGIDCNEKFNPTCYNRLSERKKMGINDGDVAVYFIGRLSPEKNPDVFVKAAGKIIKKHYKVKFFVIGDGPMRDEIKKSIDNIGNENIGYLGYQTDIPRYLSMADIFVLPSSIEGFPLSNVEAMSMGVCVISSNVGGVGDAIKDGETGFLMQPNSAEELANKIEFVISQKDILEKISKNARKSAEKNFSIEILADKYKKVYKSLYE